MSLFDYLTTLLSHLVVATKLKKPALAIAPPYTPPPSLFEPLCHPHVDQVSKEVDDYFLQHWKFESDWAKRKFLGAGFSRVTCLYFPKALDDRIHFACRLLTVLFLIDDVLDDMSFDDGSAYNEKLIPISRGDVLPDQSVPVEYVIYDLWESMRAHDKEMADEILEPVFMFMRAQTDKTRIKPMGLKAYFEYREKDVGKALLSALMRYSMAIHLTNVESANVRPMELNCSKHISVVNDIYSYEKEKLAAKEGHKEGGALCSSVQIMAGEADVNVNTAKRVLWAMCREWELCHQMLVARVESGVDVDRLSPALRDYMKGLEYQMSGNELWSRTTKRYNEVIDA